MAHMFNQQVATHIKKIMDNSRKIDQVTKVEAQTRSYQQIFVFQTWLCFMGEKLWIECIKCYKIITILRKELAKLDPEP